VVQLIYEMYAKPACTYGDIVRYLSGHGLGPADKNWTRGRIADLIRNPIYARADEQVYRFYHQRGAIIANPPADFIGVNGCYYYRGRDSVGNKHKEFIGNQLVLAPHQGLIDASLWLSCREKSCTNGGFYINQKAKNTWLAGKIKCGRCGYALLDKQNKSRGSRYLQCSGRLETHHCPGCGLLHTDSLERLLQGVLEEVLASFAPLCPANKASTDGTVAQQTEMMLLGIERDIAALLRRLPQADEALFLCINEQVSRLTIEKRRILAERADHGKTLAHLPPIAGPLRFRNDFSFDQQRQIVHLLIGAVYATSDSIIIQWTL
ncbi:MAG: recombinase family protein, partial [Clostridiales bacterium]